IQETGRDSDPLCQVKISDIFWVNCIRVNAFLATHHSYNSHILFLTAEYVCIVSSTTLPEDVFESSLQINDVLQDEMQDNFLRN
ncbi:unnamed protein product, partial [Allacma fusca]